MIHIPRKAIFPAVITIWLMLAVIFAGVFVIAERSHEHVNAAGLRVPPGENCHICFEIQIALRLMENLARPGLGMALLGFIASAFVLIKPQKAFCVYNPIDSKVKFIF